MLDEAGWGFQPDDASTCATEPAVVACEGARAKDVDNSGKIDANELMRLQLCTTAGNPTRLTELSLLSQNLLAVGIPNDVSTADATSVVFTPWGGATDDTLCSIYRGTYDMADYAYILGGDLYSNYYYTYHSSQIPSDDNPNGSNDSRLANDEMDAALTAARLRD